MSHLFITRQLEHMSSKIFLRERESYIICLLVDVVYNNCRLERVKLSCMYSKVKIIGTCLCVVGALTMSIMQSTGVPTKESPLTSPSSPVFDKQKIIGCLYLIAAVFVLSSNVVLQVTSIVVAFIKFIHV